MPDFKLLPSVNTTPVALANHTHPSDLAVWFDASQITGLSDGNAVATWPDVSGNSRHAVQATAGFRPLYKTAIRNGRPVVRFDGVDDQMATAAFATPLAQPNTIMIACRMLALSASLTIIIDGNGGSNRHIIVASTDDWQLWAGSFVANGTPDTNWHVLTAVYNGAASSLRVDGVQVLSGNPGAATLGGLTLANWSDAPGGNLNIDMAEVRVYDRLLNAYELASAEADLNTKWALGPTSDFASLVKWGTD